MTAPTPALLDQFASIVGAQNALRDAHAIAPYLTEPRGRFEGRTSLVLRPGSVAEVAAVVKLANGTGTGIVPQGGNTGLVGGQVPTSDGGEIVLSLARLNRIRAVDPAGDTMTAEAGVILADAQAAADAADRKFPLSLGSEGSCTIGGNLATNAGGTEVLAYGNARALCLGVEVVLASGEVWDGLRTLRKDNTGTDLRDLFVGSEGTLGIIAAAVLKLVPKPRGISVALLGVPSPAAAVGILGIARSRAGGMLTACELIARLGVETAARHLPGARDPLDAPHPWYVMLEVSSPRSQQEADDTQDAIFEAALGAGHAEDGVRAMSTEQSAQFWRLRHGLPEVQKHLGASLKHDVAVPIAAIPAFVERAIAAIDKAAPGARPFPFGHLGDGNLHFNVSPPPGMTSASFFTREPAINDAVYDAVLALGGTFSAEHGIGQAKRALLTRVKSATEIGMMRRIKAALDPKGILNPGKVL